VRAVAARILSFHLGSGSARRILPGSSVNPRSDRHSVTTHRLRTSPAAPRACPRRESITGGSLRPEKGPCRRRRPAGRTSSRGAPPIPPKPLPCRDRAGRDGVTTSPP